MEKEVTYENVCTKLADEYVAIMKRKKRLSDAQAAAIYSFAKYLDKAFINDDILGVEI